MATPLALRSTQVRMYIAWMAHAVYDYPKCNPGNTASRAWDTVSQDKVHPYISMWHNIGDFYITSKLKDMSDEEITESWTAGIRVGVKEITGHTTVSAESLRQAQLDWKNRGWTRYESKRAKRHKWINKGAVIGALACFGLFDFSSVSEAGEVVTEELFS
jgi:hypothetical protein